MVFTRLVEKSPELQLQNDGSFDYSPSRIWKIRQVEEVKRDS